MFYGHFMAYLWPVLWDDMLMFMACSNDGFKGFLDYLKTV